MLSAARGFVAEQAGPVGRTACTEIREHRFPLAALTELRQPRRQQDQPQLQPQSSPASQEWGFPSQPWGNACAHVSGAGVPGRQNGPREL